MKTTPKASGPVQGRNGPEPSSEKALPKRKGSPSAYVQPPEDDRLGETERPGVYVDMKDDDRDQTGPGIASDTEQIEEETQQNEDTHQDPPVPNFKELLPSNYPSEDDRPCY